MTIDVTKYNDSDVNFKIRLVRQFRRLKGRKGSVPTQWENIDVFISDIDNDSERTAVFKAPNNKHYIVRYFDKMSCNMYAEIYYDDYEKLKQ